MSNHIIIRKEEVVSIEEACHLLGDICGTTLRRYVNDGLLRRVKDRTSKCKSYIYKPDIDNFLNSRFYFDK